MSIQFKFIGEGRSAGYPYEFDYDGYQIHFQKIVPRLSRSMADFFNKIQLHDESLGGIIGYPDKSVKLFFGRGDRIRLENAKVLVETSLSPIRPNLYAMGDENTMGTVWLVDELLLDSDNAFRWNVLTELGSISFRFQNLQHSIEEILPIGVSCEFNFKFYNDMSMDDLNSEKFTKKEAEYASSLSSLSSFPSNLYNALCRKRFSLIPVQQIIEYGNRTVEIHFYNSQKLSFANVSSPAVSANPVIDLYNRYGLRVWYFDDAPPWLYHEVHIEDNQYCLIAQIGGTKISFAFAEVVLFGKMR